VKEYLSYYLTQLLNMNSQRQIIRFLTPLLKMLKNLK